MQELMELPSVAAHCEEDGSAKRRVIDRGGNFMKELTELSYEGKEIRIVQKDGEPWWVLKDVCAVLGVGNPSDVAARLDGDEKTMVNLNTLDSFDGIRGNPNMTIISESGLYNVILRSDKPEAKQFKRWVTHEVLPSIRKTGAYALPISPLDRARLVQQALLAQQEIIGELETTIAELEPKAEAFDVLMSAENTYDMAITAQQLGLGRNRLFEILREKGIFHYKYISGRKYNSVYQSYVDRAYFAIISVPVTIGDSTIAVPQIRVYQRGIDYIRKLLNQRGE